jgi:glutaredoxin-like YruB-family protein
MRHSHPSRSTGAFKLLGTLSVLGLTFSYAFLADNPTGVSDLGGPGSVRVAVADPSAKPDASSAEAKKPRNQVTVYITSWCPACRMTTDYLKKKEIPFTVKDIEKNEAYMREMIQKVGAYRGVPVLDINGRILLGFNPEALDRLAK